ncbi:calcium-binding protein [Bradyrhizobium lablabi]|uniref:calcium-binding protein n=1 Tax=Bradyrhizobium lablabi TaxID=722472 RepID=UPI001BACE5B2|nr:calcium-binding protein [Bradyrhizobium lablabi]
MNALPDGVQGLVWLDEYHGVTQEFIDKVTPFIGNPKVFGFYLVDEPDPTGQWGVQASAADLKAESDWIHQHDPGAKTFTVLMNMGTSDDPNYMNSYNQANTDIDLFGLDWYPVWTDRPNVDLSTIDKYVAAAEKAGIPLSSIVPVYQAFGGGGWQTETGSQVAVPTAAQAQAMIDHWHDLVPNPAFDYAYAWGSQNGDTALEDLPALQQVFLQHNTSGGSTSGNTTVPPVTDPVTDDPPATPVAGGGDTTGDGTPTGGSSTGDTPPATGSGGTTAPTTGTGGATGGSGSHQADSSGGSSTGDTPPVSGSAGTTDPTTPTTGSNGSNGGTGGHGHGHGASAGGGSQSPTTSDPTTSDGGDTGGHNNHQHGVNFAQWMSNHGLDFSQWKGGASSGGGTASAAPSDTTADTTADADPSTDTSSHGSWGACHGGQFASHLADMLNNHHDQHGWHS